MNTRFDRDTLLTMLESKGVNFTRYDHPPVYTCEEAKQLVPETGAIGAKNLFLRDQKGKRHFLVTAPEDARVDFAGLAEALGIKKLSLASAERLMRFLGVEPGSVSLLALFNDHEREVTGIIDSKIWSGDLLECHPLANDSTIAVKIDDLKSLLTEREHPIDVRVIPTL